MDFPYEFVDTPIFEKQRPINKGLKRRFAENAVYPQQMMLLLLERFKERQLGNTGRTWVTPQSVTIDTSDICEDASEFITIYKKLYVRQRYSKVSTKEAFALYTAYTAKQSIKDGFEKITDFNKAMKAQGHATDKSGGQQWFTECAVRSVADGGWDPSAAEPSHYKAPIRSWGP
jgi:hypothetical protein